MDQKHTTKYSELEIKYSADQVDFKKFRDWMVEEGFGYPRTVRGYDHYYRQGENVVRFREPIDNLTYELTCKVRKSAVSTQDRHEIDIHLDHWSTPEDVKSFLELAGFKYERTLYKEADIYNKNDEIHGKSNSPDIIFALYQIDYNHKYLEVEIEKSDKISIVDAKGLLAEWDQRIWAKWQVRRNNLSLYEIYTGKMYRVANEQNNHQDQ